MSQASAIPLFTADLEGIGGHIGPALEDFHVVEIPAYPPADQGSHCFVRLRKRAITSPEAATRLARAAGVRVADVGMAGMKDRWAVAEQWMSLPDLAPEALAGWSDEAVEVLETHAHPHKLRTGHLWGNRFSIRLVGTAPWSELRTDALLERLRSRGVPNRFGLQRFGRNASNAAEGYAILTGRGGPRDRRSRRLLVSALQSSLFNDYLVARLGWEHPLRPRPGELLERLPSGGVFASERPEEDEARILAGEVALTGPLFGSRMRRPELGNELDALEESVLEGAKMAREVFEGWRKLAPGGRRPLFVRAEELEVEPLDASGEVRVKVRLPAGAYATVLLHELTHTAQGELRPQAGGRAPQAGLPQGET